MKIQILSDLHFEFHQDLGLEFVKSLDTRGVDLLVVAGDLHVSRGLRLSLELLGATYPRVLYVPGNHDFYDSSINAVRELLRAAQDALPNVDVLHESVVEIEGYRFAGTPLWFEWTYQCSVLRDHVADTTAIRDFELDIRADYKRAQSFLDEVVDDETIVVTHHLPARRSVEPFFKNSGTNCFFLCDKSRLIAERQPPLWIHGHTHSSCDYTLGRTRVLCNPYGYQGRRVNRQFNPKLIVEIP